MTVENVHFDWFNQYSCTGEHFQLDLDIFQFNFRLVKPHDVSPLLCVNVQTEMWVRLKQLLFQEGSRCKKLGWYRIGSAVLILHAGVVGLIDSPAVISGRYNKSHSRQLKTHYAHFLCHCKTHTFILLSGNGRGKRWLSRHCMLAVAGGVLCDRVKRSIDHCEDGL